MASPQAWRQHLRPQLAELTVYDVEPAPSGFDRLHANECAEPWPPIVTSAVADVIREIELERYPDTSGRRLRRIIGELHDCDPARIILGNGSDEIIFIILTTLSGHAQGPGPIVIPTPTFVMYAHTAKVLGMDVHAVPLDREFQLDLPAMRRALPGAAVCFLARPNNPSGVLMSAPAIAQLVADFPETVFIIDEAYIAYAPDESLTTPLGPDNVVYMHTLSKVGCAALRVGYCVAPEALATCLNKVRHPYNISSTSLAIAECLLSRFKDEQAQMVARVLVNRARLVQLLQAIPGAETFESAANLVLVRLPEAGDPARLCQHLATQKILIKNVSLSPGLTRCVRVTVGTQPELDRLETALADYG